MNYFLDAEGKGRISNIGKTKFFTTKKYSKLFLSLIFKYHNGIWSIFPSATWLAILGKSVWFWSKDDIEYSWAGNHYTTCISLELQDCYSDHSRTGLAKECVIWHLSLHLFTLWAARSVSWKCPGTIGEMTKEHTFLDSWHLTLLLYWPQAGESGKVNTKWSQMDRSFAMFPHRKKTNLGFWSSSHQLLTLK